MDPAKTLLGLDLLCLGRVSSDIHFHLNAQAGTIYYPVVYYSLGIRGLPLCSQ
jgi:hypothetical protein